MLIGLISDTHGALDPSAESALAGADAIIHAGDVCSAEILWRLEAIAPVTAVAGNCDTGGETGVLPHTATLDAGGLRILVVHDLTDVGGIPDGVDVVVCGHTHRPREQWHGPVLVVNPGSASQRRSMPGTSVAFLEVTDGAAEFWLVPLESAG